MSQNGKLLQKEDIFMNINKHYVKMKKKDKKTNTAILFSVLEEIIKIMRISDILFDNMKPTLDFLGSYFDRLRVSQPNEYDINVILTFPVNYSKIKLDATNSCKGHTAIIMPSEFRRLAKIPSIKCKGFAKTELWCNKNHCLSVSKFRAWMQSTVDKALNTLPLKEGKRMLKVNGKCYKIMSKLMGPANSFRIFKEDDTVIDLDLVPTFCFQLPKTPINTDIIFSKVESSKISKYFVVPKPTGDDFSWRLTFPFQERSLIHNKYNLKSTLRLLKLLRDVQGFNKLSSYYIKTIFLWESVQKDDLYWKHNSLSFLVLSMLNKVKENLSQGRIENFWCPGHNLLVKVKEETCQNWCERLSLIIKKIEDINHKDKDPYIILQYFQKK